MKKLDPSVVQKLMTRVEAMPARQKLRPYDVIAQMAETISSAQLRGNDLDDLMEALHEVGITLAKNTVRNYLSRALAARKRPAHEPHARAPAAARLMVVTPPQVPPPTSAGTNDYDAELSSGTASARPTPPLSPTPPPQPRPSGSSAANQSVVEYARSRALERAASAQTDDELPTPGSFRIRPDKENL